MPITCPNGHVNDAGNRFCDQCGAQLTAAPASGSAPIQAAQPMAEPVDAAPAAPTPTPDASASGSPVCATCGQENLPGTAFCENCGAPLPPPEPAQAPSIESAPAAQAPATGTMTCANCGSVNEPGNAFCEQCGASLATSSADSGAPAAPVADDNDASAAAASAETALDTPGAQSQPATEEAQPPADTTTGDDAATAQPPSAEATPAVEAAPAAEAEAEPTPVELEPVVQAAPAESEQAVAAEPAPPVTAQPATETCANCGVELPANAKFCLECGTRVERTPPPPPPEPELVRPTHCQNCGAELPANAKFCLECGTKVELIPADTAKPAAPAAETTSQQQASQSQGGTLPTALDVAMVRADATGALPDPPAQSQAAPVAPPVQQQAPVGQGGPRLISSNGTTISLPPQGELVVGREDPVSGIHPDIDMTPHGGEAGGVSRRHAIIRQRGGQWTVTDLDSTNYTRIDGNRITPNIDVTLHDGARIQFGRVQFEFRSQ